MASLAILIAGLKNQRMHSRTPTDNPKANITAISATIFMTVPFSVCTPRRKHLDQIQADCIAHGIDRQFPNTTSDWSPICARPIASEVEPQMVLVPPFDVGAATHFVGGPYNYRTSENHHRTCNESPEPAPSIFSFREPHAWPSI